MYVYYAGRVHDKNTRSPLPLLIIGLEEIVVQALDLLVVFIRVVGFQLDVVLVQLDGVARVVVDNPEKGRTKRKQFGGRNGVRNRVQDIV